MFAAILLLLAALVIVFLAAQAFTNAIEHLGERLGVSEGVTGSVFAAIATAMPETIIPIVAIVAGGSNVALNHAVGVGAILGAPFMLSTLSIGLMAWFAGRRRGWREAFTPESGGMRRDMHVFALAFLLVVGAALMPSAWQPVQAAIAALLFIIYFFYLMDTIRSSQGLVADGHATEADDALYLARLFGDAHWVAVMQLAAALALLVWGAKLFVAGVEQVSTLAGVPALLVSLLVVPIATELPEKVNSILWIRRARDTLAFGNITGAMVFQGTVIPGLAMLLIPWHIDDVYALAAILMTVLGVGWLYWLHGTGRLQPRHVMLNMALYGAFVLFAVIH
ncbi:MAG TPA: sodium:calcium antiporter [Mariprofundaceae bacterium]|nr:sodium:calcium antiporter [Mariprofundaceae bacterium]